MRRLFEHDPLSEDQPPFSNHPPRRRLYDIAAGQEVPAVFQPFFQARRQDADAKTPTGVALVIAGRFAPALAEAFEDAKVTSKDGAVSRGQIVQLPVLKDPAGVDRAVSRGRLSERYR
jgi:hypothetical protein